MIYELTCHTDVCENKDITITMETEATTFVCGVCGNEITDVEIPNTATTIKVKK
jgi:predicted RNA-binding Zn-ribbon protein involved in translation (DUF1610 family)